MATPDRQGKPYTFKSEQSVLNNSYDELFQILAFMNVEWDGGNGLFRKQSSNVAMRLDNTTTANTIYIGKAPIGSVTSGAVWQIFKLDTSSGLIKTWADGDSAFDNVWNNRASLSYS